MSHPNPGSPTDPTTPLSRAEIARRIAKIRFNPETSAQDPLPPLDATPGAAAIDVCLAAWKQRVEDLLTRCAIRRAQWADAALLCVDDEALRMIMRSVREAHYRGGWTWNQFLDALRLAIEERERRREEMCKTVGKVAKVGGIAAGAAILGPPLLVGALGAAGFTASGVAAGSLAATIQSTFYGAATTGLFSICQSIGATGAVSAATTLLMGAGAGAAAAGAEAALASRGPHEGGQSQGGPAGGGRDGGQGKGSTTTKNESSNDEKVEIDDGPHSENGQQAAEGYVLV